MKIAAGFFLLCVPLLAGAAPVSNIRPDEEVIFFPSMGWVQDGATQWQLEINGCVFEPERRRLAISLLLTSLRVEQIQLTAAEDARFRERSRLFMVDNKRGRSVVVRIGEKSYRLGKSEPNGHFSGTIRLSESEIARVSWDDGRGMRQVPFRAVLPSKDARVIAGNVILVPAAGVMVVSDIDDTLKVSEVRDRDALLRNTFVNAFEAVPGMAAAFATWTNLGPLQFFYVSASPWQLYLPLSRFIRSNQFPAGVFVLKDFRWKDRSVLALFENPEEYKISRIEALMQRHPGHRFVLVGDSGERDPEAYGELARRHPQQVLRIWIRDVTGEAQDSARYPFAFRDLAPGTGRVFRDAGELRERFP